MQANTIRHLVAWKVVVNNLTSFVSFQNVNYHDTPEAPILWNSEQYLFFFQSLSVPVLSSILTSKLLGLSMFTFSSFRFNMCAVWFSKHSFLIICSRNFSCLLMILTKSLFFLKTFTLITCSIHGILSIFLSKHNVFASIIPLSVNKLSRIPCYKGGLKLHSSQAIVTLFLTRFSLLGGIFR